MWVPPSEFGMVMGMNGTVMGVLSMLYISGYVALPAMLSGRSGFIDGLRLLIVAQGVWLLLSAIYATFAPPEALMDDEECELLSDEEEEGAEQTPRKAEEGPEQLCWLCHGSRALGRIDENRGCPACLVFGPQEARDEREVLARRTSGHILPSGRIVGTRARNAGVKGCDGDKRKADILARLADIEANLQALKAEI